MIKKLLETRNILNVNNIQHMALKLKSMFNIIQSIHV